MDSHEAPLRGAGIGDEGSGISEVATGDVEVSRRLGQSNGAGGRFRGPLRPPAFEAMRLMQEATEAAWVPGPIIRTYLCQCGKSKSGQRSLCDACWGKLPTAIRGQFRDHFDRAYFAAVEFLRIFGK